MLTTWSQRLKDKRVLLRDLLLSCQTSVEKYGKIDNEDERRICQWRIFARPFLPLSRGAHTHHPHTHIALRKLYLTDPDRQVVHGGSLRDIVSHRDPKLSIDRERKWERVKVTWMKTAMWLVCVKCIVVKSDCLLDACVNGQIVVHIYSDYDKTGTTQSRNNLQTFNQWIVKKKSQGLTSVDVIVEYALLSGHMSHVN